MRGDKDFIQLQKYKNVSQYSPITKKFVNGEDPALYLKEHILKGDASDGIPNVLSPDNTFVDGLRQRPLGKKKIDAWIDNDIHDVLQSVFPLCLPLFTLFGRLACRPITSNV